MRLAMLVFLPLIALAACGQSEPVPAATTSDWPSFEQPAPATPSASPEPSTPLPKACELVSAAEAEAVLGQEVTLMSDDPENCMWASSGGMGIITMLLVQPSEQEDLAMAQSVFNTITGLTGNLAGMVNQQIGESTKKSGQELDDLGDEAWRSTASVGADFGGGLQVGSQQLVVRKGRRLLTLNVTGSTKTNGLAQRLEALARAAAPKL